MPYLMLLKRHWAGAQPAPIPVGPNPFTIGRDERDCQVVIPHRAVSRRHARIVHAQGRYYIEDLKSRNHTFVNDEEVTGRTVLEPGDRIRISEFLFQFA